MPADDADLDLSSWSKYWQSGDYVLYCPRLKKGCDAIDISMIYDIHEHSVACIESDDLSYAVKKRMFDEGVPIVSVRPPGENILEKAKRVLSCLDRDKQKFAAAYNEIRAMKVS